MTRAIDRAVETFSPGRALRRFNQRRALEFAYRAAKSTRIRTIGMGKKTADEEILDDLPKLRASSRELLHNSGLAQGIMNTLTHNIVGTGVQLKPIPRAARLGLPEGTVDEFQEAARDAWELWVRHADATERTDFGGLLDLVQRSIFEGGDVFTHYISIDNGRRPFDLALDLIEADRVDSFEEKAPGGIVLGKYGQPKAFLVHDDSDILQVKKPRRIQRYDSATGELICEQHFVRLRCGQNRGVPILAPVLQEFHDLSDYMESERIAAHVNACVAAAITSPDADSILASQATETDADGRLVEQWQAGKFYYLYPGEQVQMINPTRPTAAFDPYVTKILRLICRGLDLPFELGALDFSKTNYSSARAALLEVRKMFLKRRVDLAYRLCQPTYELVMEEAWGRGMFPMVPKSHWVKFRREWTRADWIWDGWGWVDPQKEIAASQLAIEAGLSTREIETRRWTGRNWLDLEEARAREEKASKEIRQRVLGDSAPKPEENQDASGNPAA